MNVLSYFNPDTHERDNDGVLGLLIDTVATGIPVSEFLPIDCKELDGWLNGCDNVKSFALQIDNGNCTFTKELRKSGDRIKSYWYASKRINGKLKRLYFGTKFTKENLLSIVDKFNQESKPVTQKVTQNVNHFAIGDMVTYENPDELYKRQRGVGKIVDINEENLYICWQDLPKMQAPFWRYGTDKLVLAAGHGKSANHVQPSLIEPDLHEEIAVLNNIIRGLKEDLEEIKTREHKTWVENGQLKGKLKKLLNHDELCHSQQLKIDALEQQVREQEILIETLRVELVKSRDEAHSHYQQYQQLEWESTKREDDVQGYAFMFQEHSDKIFQYQTLIEKYRLLAAGKTKSANPRFAYLIDFLSDIDKLC